MSTKRIWSISLLCLLIALPAAAESASGEKRRHRPFSDAEYWAGVWDTEERDQWQKPVVLVELMGIRRGETVADLGAGTGYLTKILAISVGDRGKVYAVDVEQSLLDHLTSREDILQDRVVPILARRNDPGLPAGEVDLIVILNTWHHIKKRPRYIDRLGEALSPEGRIVVVDYREGDLPVGPRPSHKLARDEVIDEFTEAGWRFVSESVALPYQYYLVFLPPGEPDEAR